jgi:zinc ribbon protein
MAQTPGRSCPNCGGPITAGQRFCTNCGTVLEAPPPSQYGGMQQQNYPPAQQPPPYAQPPQQPLPYMQPPQQKQSPIAEAFGALGLLFLLRRSGLRGYVPRRKSSGCCGCLVLLVILLVVLGLPGYFAFRNRIPALQNTINSVSSGNTSGILATPPLASPTTTQLNETVNYAGVDITILNAQQASSFSDDNNSSTNELVRLNLNEKAGPAVGSFLYGDVMRLVLPDKTTIVPSRAQNDIGPEQGTTRTNWIDFTVPTNTKIDQLTLLLGTDKEAQMSVPLSSGANLSAYQLKTASPNTSIQYAGLAWTVTSVTLAWNYYGHQADKGMRYVIVQFRIDNPTSNQFTSGFPEEYMRLKSGGATSAPAGNSTLPITVPANSSGATGVVAFQVPEGVTSYTLILLGKPNISPPISQSTTNFHVA